jgi:hypothetical protein
MNLFELNAIDGKTYRQSQLTPQIIATFIPQIITIVLKNMSHTALCDCNEKKFYLGKDYLAT